MESYSELLKSKDYNRIMELTEGKEDSPSLYARFLAYNDDLRGNSELRELSLCEKAIENAELEEELKMRGEVSLYESLISIPFMNNIMRDIHYENTDSLYDKMKILISDTATYPVNTDKLVKAFKYIVNNDVKPLALDYYLLAVSYLYLLNKEEAYEVLANKLLKYSAYQESLLPKFIMPLTKDGLMELLEKVHRGKVEEPVEEAAPEPYHFGFWDVARITVVVLATLNIISYIIFVSSEFQNWMMLATVIPYGVIGVVSLFYGLYKFMEYFFLNDLKGILRENKWRKRYYLFLIIYLVLATALFFWAMIKFNFDTSAW